MTKTYRNDILAAVHETAEDLHDAGVMEKRALRRFDEMCLTPVEPMDAAAIRALRGRERVSQAVNRRAKLTPFRDVFQCSFVDSKEQAWLDSLHEAVVGDLSEPRGLQFFCFQ